MLVAELKNESTFHHGGAVHRVLRDHTAFILYFHLQVFRRKERFREVDDFEQFAGREDVIGVVAKPHLQLNMRRGANGAPAVDEIFGDMADLGHVKVSGNGLTVVEDKADLFIRASTEVLFEGVKIHGAAIIFLNRHMSIATC